MNLTQSQWHMIAAADDIIKRDGHIVGVVFDGAEIIFIEASQGLTDPAEGNTPEPADEVTE